MKRQRGDSDAIVTDEARRTLRFIVSAAAQTAFPGRVLVGGHALGGAHLFCFEVGDVSAADVDLLSKAVKKLIADDVPIEKVDVDFAEACAHFKANGLRHSLGLLETRVQSPSTVHRCGTTMRLALHPLLSRTSQAGAFSPTLTAHAAGVLLSFAAGPPVISPTLLTSAMDHKRWGSALDVRGVGALNGLKGDGRELTDFILHAEFRQEAIISNLAAQVDTRSREAATDSQRVGVICSASRVA